MNLETFTANLQHTLKPRTVVFLLKDSSVLLGYKKTGFGNGKYVGIGGKVEPGESIEEAAIREMQEETSITPIGLQLVAILRFYFPHIEDESWNQEVHAFISTTWEGEPTETDELRPEWFNVEDVPYDKMWDDSHSWITQILAGERLEGDFMFNEELKVVEKKVAALRI
jgi:8-oxo-dGTP pyrophosphatase MutT (NUDIX family)